MSPRVRPWIAPVFVLAISMPALAGAVRGDSIAPSSSAPPAAQIRRDSLRKCLAGLDLSGDQKSQIEAYLESQKETVAALHATLDADRQVLRDAIESGSTDACALGADVLTIQADRQALRAELDQIKAGVEAFLTPDQKTRLEGCLDAFRSLADPSTF